MAGSSARDSAGRQLAELCPDPGKKYFGAVDLCKLICAFLVAAIHVSPLESVSTAADHLFRAGLARIAVPFFFTASGFFLFRKTSQTDFDFSAAKRYALRLLRLYVIWTVIYFPLSLKTQILANSAGPLAGFAGWLRCFLFSGSFVHLWFLPAAAVAALLISLMLRRGASLKAILLTAAGLYAVCLLGQTYHVLLRPLESAPVIGRVLWLYRRVFISTQNGVFLGFPFVAVGMALAYRPVHLSRSAVGAGLALSALLFALEVVAVMRFGWAKDYSAYIFLVPLVFFLFLALCRCELPPRRAYLHMRDTGMLIFYLHILVSMAVKALLALTGAASHPILGSSVSIYLLTLVFSVAAAHLIILLSDMPRLSWLKRLYK